VQSLPSTDQPNTAFALALSCQRHLAGQALAALCAASMQLQPRAAARRLAQQLLHTTGRTIRPGTSFTQRAGAARYRCEAPRTLCARRLLCGTRFVVMPQPPPALPAAARRPTRPQLVYFLWRASCARRGANAAPLSSGRSFRVCAATSGQATWMVRELGRSSRAG
jgi:hypothetical protein